MARAAVIIPHYNDVARLTRCLEALMPQVVEGVEVVVVDNGSTEDLELVRQAYTALRIITEDEKGAGPARNRGVAETEGEWLFFLDADCVPGAGWLAEALRLADLPETQIVGGRVEVFDETPAPRSGSEAFETIWAFRQRDYVEKKGFTVTANMLVHRDVFEATGPFINGMPEDMEWCHRARAKGYALSYADALAVSHPTRANWSALRRKWLRLTEERFAYERPRIGRLGWGLRALLVPLNALRQTLRAFALPGLGGGDRRRALATLARLTGRRVIWMLRQALGRPIR